MSTDSGANVPPPTAAMDTANRSPVPPSGFAGGSDGGGHVTLTRRQLRAASAVLAVLAVTVVAVFALGGPTAKGRAGVASRCFITGAGNKLCGADAIAFCDIHYADYLQADDIASAESCDSIAPGRHCAEAANHNYQVAEFSHADGYAVAGNPQIKYSEPGCPR